MDKQELLKSLDALRAEIATASEVDPEMADELRRLTNEFRKSADEGEPAEAESDAPHGLKDLVLQFEAEHPQLSVAVGRVVDALAAMGF
jgi:hypothetical protein